MRRASYRHGVELIALNDEPTETDLDQIEGQISVQLLADLFGVPPMRVAKDILKKRQALEKRGEL